MAKLNILNQSLAAPDELPFQDLSFSDAYSDVIVAGMDFEELTLGLSTLNDLREQAVVIREALGHLRERVDEMRLSHSTLPERGVYLSACSAFLQANQISISADHFLLGSGALQMKQAARNIADAVRKLG